jgi:hypothetical protein
VEEDSDEDLDEDAHRQKILKNKFEQQN